MREVLIEKYGTPAILNNGATLHWKDKNNELHRFNDLPAVINNENDITNTILYYIHGKCHRKNNKPAYIIKNKSNIITEERYYENGYVHRENGPAVITESVIIWVLNGEIHRDADEPSVEYANKRMIAYYQNNIIHRIGKPAKIVGIYNYWYEEGILKDKKIFYSNKFLNYIVNNYI